MVNIKMKSRFRIVQYFLFCKSHIKSEIKNCNDFLRNTSINNEYLIQKLQAKQFFFKTILKQLNNAPFHEHKLNLN